MTVQRKSLILAAVHVAIVASLGAKLLADRVTRPRVWARSVPYDPDLPIRGRYVRLRLEVAAAPDLIDRDVELAVRNGTLTAVAAPDRTGLRVMERPPGAFVLGSPVAFFIPEHVDDPSRRSPGEDLWVEVTLPRRGPPRPIRLGVRKAGTLTPLELR